MQTVCPTTDDQKELFIVVDVDDIVIGYRTRYDCHHDRNLIHRTVGVAVFHTDGRLLLQKRSHTKDMDANMWGMSSAGHVLKNESVEVAAIRELKEELGIVTPIRAKAKFLTKDDRESEMATLFTATYDGPFYPDPIETSGVQFFTRSEVRVMISESGVSRITKGTIDGLHALGWID